MSEALTPSELLMVLKGLSDEQGLPESSNISEEQIRGWLNIAGSQNYGLQESEEPVSSRLKRNPNKGSIPRHNRQLRYPNRMMKRLCNLE